MLLSRRLLRTDGGNTACAGRKAAFAATASGFAALCYEVSWLAQVRLLTGHTAEAMAATLALFLAGLGLGAAAAAGIQSHLSSHRGCGPHSHGNSNEIEFHSGVLLKAYVACELGAAFSGALVLMALQAMVMGAGAWSGAGLWLMVAALLAVPTVLLGAALPLLMTVAQVPQGERVSSGPTSFAWLYAWNTAGAALGALGAGWVILPLGGHWGLATAAALCNGAAAVLVLRGYGLQSRSPSTIARRDSHAFIGPHRPLALGAALIVSGWATVALQILWYRLAQLAFGPSVWVFPSVLCALLVGMALAAFRVGRAGDNRVAGVAPSLLPLFTAIAVVGGTVLWGSLPPVVLSLHHFFGGEAPFAVMQSALLLSCALACTPVAYCMGLIFPQLAIAFAPRAEGAGRTLALNIAGALIAALTVPLCLRTVGLSGATVLLTVVGFAMAAGVSSSWMSQGRYFLDVPTLISASLTVALLVALLPLDQRLLTSGAFHNRVPLQALRDAGYTDVGAYLTERLPPLTAVADDGSSLISAHATDDGRRIFRINGKIDGGTGGDRSTNELVARLPFLVQEPGKPLENVVTIGLGTGATHAAVLAEPSVKQAVVVEVSPRVAEFAAEHFPEYAPSMRALQSVSGVKKNPTIAHSILVIADGRAYLRGQKPQSLDLIVSEPSNPWVEGEAGLFSEEYFHLVASRLKATGLASLWFHSYGMSCESVLPVFAALTKAFPRLLLFHVDGDYFAVASPTAGPPLQYSGADSAAFLTASLWHDESTLTALTAGVAPHRDVHPRLAYAAGRTFASSVQCKLVEQRRMGDPLARSAARGAWEARFGE